MALNTLDLFSGIGGFARGLEATNFFNTTCFVEQDPYCQAVLKHHWPDVPVLGDIRSVQGPDLPIRPDVICGGFPCQPFSHAGKQQAQDDPRHLWPEMFRLIRECRPTWVVGENVIGLVQLGLDEVLSDLESEGYATRTFNIPACAVGAPHIRQRIWIVAHADSESEPDGAFDGNERQRQLGFDFVANAEDADRGQQHQSRGGMAGQHSIQREGSEDSAGHTGRGSHGRGHVADATDNRPRWREQLTQGGQGKGHVADAKRPRTRVEAHRGGSKECESPNTPKPKILPQGNGPDSPEGASAGGNNVADATCVDGPWSVRQGDRAGRPEASSGGIGSTGPTRPEDYWQSEPEVGRLAHGVSNRVSQLRALGNTIIPQIAEEIGYAIAAAEGAD